MEFSAIAFLEILTQWVWPLAQFIIGLGLVVFVHEFGHFLAAKAVGIKVERFALGFGPRVLGFVRGETDYCIRLLPLGGYIKMLGQEDFGPLEDEQEVDPRSYNAKPVWARLVVVSAGVVMNAILALVLFTTIAFVGKDFSAPMLGDVKAHYPASQVKITWNEGPKAATQPVVTTGLKPGDRVTRIEGEGVILWILGNEVTRFDQLAMLSILADEDDTFRITVEREVDGVKWVGAGELSVRMGPGEMGGERLSFGISPDADTLVSKFSGGDYAATDGYGPFRKPVPKSFWNPDPNPVDRIVAVAGTKVDYQWQVEPILRGLTGPTVDVTVLREGKEVTVSAPRLVRLRNAIYFTDGTKINTEDYASEESEDGKSYVFTSLIDRKKITRPKDEVILAPRDELMDLLGMVPRLTISGINEDSGAEKAKLEPGDLIVHYGDTALPTAGQLRKTNQKVKGEGAKIFVQRGGERLEGLAITPDEFKDTWLVGITQSIDACSTIVAHVRKGSPAEKAGIEKGCVLDKINDTPVASWLEAYDAMKGLAGQEVSLTYRTDDKPETEAKTVSIGVLDRNAFDPNDYELTLFPDSRIGLVEPLKATIRKDSLPDAMGWGVRETGVLMVSTYASLRSLIRGTVSTKGVLGPVGMGGIAISAARRGLVDLVYFMAYISAILAVINFLPLPVVDGGHAVFLILEKVRGKPLPVKIMNIIQIAGLVLLLGVFVAVTFQDIMRYFT